MLIRNAVLLGGRQCSLLARPLADAVRRARARGDRIDSEYEALVEELGLAGRAWRASVAASGSSELPELGEIGLSWDAGSKGESDTREAALLLGVTPRQVRSLIGTKLTGRMVGGSWRIQLESLERERERRGLTSRRDIGLRAA